MDLTPEWKDYALLPDRFKAWPVPAAGGPRGQFHPERAVSCCVGLAMSHTALEGVEHEYWFDDLGTAPNPFGDDEPPAEPQIPVLESVSPSYQCFPITTPVVVRADHQKVPLEEWEASGGRASSRALTSGDSREDWAREDARPPRQLLLAVWPPPARAGRGLRPGAALSVGAAAGGLRCGRPGLSRGAGGAGGERRAALPRQRLGRVHAGGGGLLPAAGRDQLLCARCCRA